MDRGARRAAVHGVRHDRAHMHAFISSGPHSRIPWTRWLKPDFTRHSSRGRKSEIKLSSSPLVRPPSYWKRSPRYDLILITAKDPTPRYIILWLQPMSLGGETSSAHNSTAGIEWKLQKCHNLSRGTNQPRSKGHFDPSLTNF